jgi:hypothetical protein
VDWEVLLCGRLVVCYFTAAGVREVMTGCGKLGVDRLLGNKGEVDIMHRIGDVVLVGCGSRDGGIGVCMVEDGGGSRICFDVWAVGYFR